MASALPYILVLLVLISGGRLADYLRRHFLSTGTVRKIFNTLGKVQEGYGIAWGKLFPCLKQHEKAQVSWSISHTHKLEWKIRDFWWVLRKSVSDAFTSTPQFPLPFLLPNPHLWSVQARTSEKHIFSDLEIGRDSAWLSFEAFSFGCFPLCQSHVCLSQVLSYWDEARLNDNWNGRVALVEVTLLDSGLPRFFAPPLPSRRFLFCAVLPTG